MRGLPGAATSILLSAVAGCGGGSEDAAPAEWCHGTSRIVYLIVCVRELAVAEMVGRR